MAWMNYLYAYLTAREEEEGQGMVEYALILALVSVVAIAALLVLGPAISDIFDEVTANLGIA
jgi:pilus assembly protein Flp/PilA